MLATEPRLAIVWDEGYTLGREARIRLWFRALRDPAAFAADVDAARPRDELVQQDRWPAPRADRVDTRAKLFDPAGARLVLAVRPRGAARAPAVLRDRRPGRRPRRAGLGRPAAGPVRADPGVQPDGRGLFAFVARRWGAWAGAAAAGAWALQPQLFGHGHYATYDALLTCLWVDAILAFWLAVEPGEDGTPRRRPRWGWAVAFGVLLGWAADTKLTGWFLPLPFLAWVGLYARAGPPDSATGDGRPAGGRAGGWRSGDWRRRRWSRSPSRS